MCMWNTGRREGPPESSAGVPVKAAIVATTQEVAQNMLAQS